ncbi:branched-chain amino acid transport system substrate-binding protein [Bradyrhizobium sp. JR3.5]
MTRTRKPGVSRRSTLALMGAGAVSFAAPWVARAQAKTIKIGMPTILSGRVAQLGTSSRNAVMLEVEKVNAAGGLAGRQIEMVIRDSKGQPQEAARIARELVNTDGCEMLLDGEASSGSFAVHEVARDLGVLCIHTCSEASSLTADPKQHIPNAFRCVRQGIHDSIVGAGYAAGIAKAKGLKKWATCSPDYAYGRDTTGEFVLYLKKFAPDVEIISESWPKLFQPDYTEVVTKILQAKPQALYSCLWGGDLTSYIDQANIYAMFTQMEVFAVNMADYTALTVVKNLPKGIHSGDRYIKTFPPTPENAAWGRCLQGEVQRVPDQLVLAERDGAHVPQRGRQEGELDRRQEGRGGAHRAHHQMPVRCRRHRDHARRRPHAGRLRDRLGHNDPSGALCARYEGR